MAATVKKQPNPRNYPAKKNGKDKAVKRQKVTTPKKKNGDAKKVKKQK